MFHSWSPSRWALWENAGWISANVSESRFELWFPSDCQGNGGAGLWAELDLWTPRWVIVMFCDENWRIKTRDWLFTNESNRLMKSGVWITHDMDTSAWSYTNRSDPHGFYHHIWRATYIVANDHFVIRIKNNLSNVKDMWLECVYAPLWLQQIFNISAGFWGPSFSAVFTFLKYECIFATTDTKVIQSLTTAQGEHQTPPWGCVLTIQAAEFHWPVLQNKSLSSIISRVAFVKEHLMVDIRPLL